MEVDSEQRALISFEIALNSLLQFGSGALPIHFVGGAWWSNSEYDTQCNLCSLLYDHCSSISTYDVFYV